MHPAAFHYVRRTVGQYPIPMAAKVVEIGGRNINGTIRDLFDIGTDGVYLCTDLYPGPGVDVVVDGAALNLESPADVAVCCEVLEHAANAQAIVANMARCVGQGGRVIITAAGCGEGWARAPHSAWDGCQLREGEHYANISASDLMAWLAEAGCSDIEVSTNPQAGDVYATARTPARQEEWR